MKLSTKFLILGLILFLTVVASLGIAGWAVATADEEIRNTYGEISRALDDVDAVKVAFEKQSSLFHREFDRLGSTRSSDQASLALPTDDEVDEFNLQRQVIVDRLGRLMESPASRARIGDRIFTFIQRRSRALLNEFDVAMQRWRAEDESRLRAILKESLPRFEELHTLIESLEQRLLVDLGSSLEYGAGIRRLLYRVLVTSLVIALLVGVLGWLLLRRWVAAPIDRLRHATGELREGHFDHRIPVTSRDELGALSGEVNQLAATIVEMQAKLIERERLAAVGEMMRRIVHNLRNPLAGIRTLAELTRSELPEDSDERENQDRILSTVDRFERWLNDVLQSTVPLEVRPIPGSTRDFIESVIEPHRGSARAKSIQIEYEADSAPATAPFDGRHLQHALAALVANAIEATPNGGRVRIRSRATDDGAPETSLDLEPEWELVIEDSGEGVAPGARDRIFEPYFTTKRHGTGIGLAVTRNVIQAHGGQIRVGRSELGGAAFIIRLPLKGLGAGADSGQNYHHRG